MSEAQTLQDKLHAEVTFRNKFSPEVIQAFAYPDQQTMSLMLLKKYCITAKKSCTTPNCMVGLLK